MLQDGALPAFNCGQPVLDIAQVGFHRGLASANQPQWLQNQVFDLISHHSTHFDHGQRTATPYKLTPCGGQPLGHHLNGEPMRYPIAIEPGTDATAWGVVVPDLHGAYVFTGDVPEKNAYEPVGCTSAKLLIDVRMLKKKAISGSRVCFYAVGHNVTC